ncbi:MAG: diguanylate cyclase [Pseudomonas sp.]|uniref:diguanylate cyclase domain-containing protein n=1 Tax=Pseudomonas sp. TaxID=306 RepID=UPI003396F2EF
MNDPGASNPPLEEYLQQLGQQFAERLQQELPALAEQARQLLAVESEAQRQAALLALRDQLHKLAGSAGTFGFGGLGERARALEQQADQWLQQTQQQRQVLEAFSLQVAELQQQLEPTAPAPPLPSPPSAVPRGEPQPRCIYILESLGADGESVRQTLSTFGYQAEHYSGIAELDAALQRHVPDALIVDSELPDETQSGLQYAKALQQRLDAPLPLLVISAQDDFATHLEAVRAGAIGLFSKPLDLPKLENCLDRCFVQQQGEPYRVLIIDDDRDLASRYSLVLRGANMQVQMLHTPAELFSHLREFNPEVVLLDVNMPDCSGPELAQIIRFYDDWLRVPIIYLSAETDIARQMNAMLKAGDDFVTKPISDNSLVATVFARAQRARLLSMALARDSLTGLLKHADIKEQVAIELERALRNETRASVAMLDIDHFKQVNDRHGHAAGDNVIRALANLLRQRLRRVDSLGRYGGEEFLAVLPDCPADQAQRILDEIRERFAALQFVAAGQTFQVTFSAGFVLTDSQSSASELLERADRALYGAKHGGRNQVRQAD